MEAAKYLISVLVVSVAFSTAAFADLLTLKPGTAVKNGVNISASATAAVGGKSYDLTTVGSGLRNKVVLINIPVYIAQLMVSDPSRYVKTDSGALPSLDAQTSVAIRLTFLRDVDAPSVTEAFQDSLDANGISAKDPDIVQFMNVVNKNGDAKNAGSLTIFITKNSDGSETVAYENINGATSSPSTMNGARGLTHKIMSIWLGTVSEDSGLAALKAQLLQ